MPFDHLKMLDIIETMEGFLGRKRPPEEICPKLDFGYKIEGHSVFIFEIRPAWDNPEIYLEYSFAKATYVIAKDHWKIYWMRASGKWDLYKPKQVVKTLKKFTGLVEEDT